MRFLIFFLVLGVVGHCFTCILDSEKSEEKPQLENMESKPATAPTETQAAPNPPPVAPEANEEKGSGNPIEGNFWTILYTAEFGPNDHREDAPHFICLLGFLTYLEFSHASNGFNGRCR